ncbi:MAG: ABC transporter ATP-binding protein [Tannerellaceae bacterium]|jgi:lipoprotein-releasing system ATP-binding protein|nr:ABC transporter ATP-binding protein [Tannerellaceae bacterium]
MVHAKRIFKKFGSLQVLKGVDMEVRKGEVVAIVGPSGAGKTTLLQILGTLDGADSGELRINGRSPSGMNDRGLSAFRNHNIGFIFQFHQLLPEFTALENVMIPALIARENPNSAKKRACDLLRFMGLSERIDHKPTALSGGERQRVAVARALINRPAIVLADEPSGSLDSQNKEELHHIFFSLRDKFEQTFIIVTHDEQFAQRTDRRIYLRDGLVVPQ